MSPNAISQTPKNHVSGNTDSNPARQFITRHTDHSGRFDTRAASQEIASLMNTNPQLARQIYQDAGALLEKQGNPLDNHHFKSDVKNTLGNDFTNLVGPSLGKSSNTDPTPRNEETQAPLAPTISGFIQEEGLNVLLRTGQVVGGAGQVLLGAGICSGVVTCTAGGLIALKGLDNIQAGLRGKDSASQQLLAKATGDEQTATIINAGIDLGTSVGGLAQSVPKLNSLGNPARTLFVRDPTSFEPAIMQASKQSLMLEGATSTTTIIDAID